MRIALRPSGGRGDYELAGTYNRISASELFERRFFFQVTPSLVIDGKAEAHRLAGKPRIRPTDDGRHAYRIVSAILLLPHPRRELLRTDPSSISLRTGSYVVGGIDVDVVVAEKTKVVFAPKAVWAKSRAGVLKVDYAERMGLITTLWNAAPYSKTRIGTLLRRHAESIAAGDHPGMIDSAEAIQAHYRISDDVLPRILQDFGLVGGAADPPVAGEPSQPSEFNVVDDPTQTDAAKRERVRKWRKQAERGPGGREFSVHVRVAYDFRCIFSKERLPKLSVCDSSGVDGAHILPWSTHQLNSINNGLCLCKLCHWAFDAGLFRLDFDAKVSRYVLTIPDEFQTAAAREQFDLDRFRALTGPLAPNSLPRNKTHWPSPANLEELNASS